MGVPTLDIQLRCQAPVVPNIGWWYTYPSEKYETQFGLLFPKYRKIKIHVPNQQPDWIVSDMGGMGRSAEIAGLVFNDPSASGSRNFIISSHSFPAGFISQIGYSTSYGIGHHFQPPQHNMDALLV